MQSGWLQRMRERDIPIQIRFLAFDVHRIDGIEPEPGGKGEPVLIRPLGHRWQDDGLYGKRDDRD